MAKMEELLELLVSEIKDFEEAIKRLEEIRKAKITIDIAELKKALAEHEAGLEKNRSAIDENSRQFERILKNAKIYPKWAIIVFMMSLILNCIAAAVLLSKLQL